MNEYIIRELTGETDKLFALMEYSGMGVFHFGESFLHILRGEAGWFLIAHEAGSETYVKKHLADDGALRLAAEEAESLYHVDGRLRHGIYTLINALEAEILKHDRVSAKRCRQRQEGVRTS